MAGSLDKFLYQEDSPDGTTAGRIKLLTLDESNQRAMGEVPATSATATAAGATFLDKLNGNERYITVKGKTAAGIVVTRDLIVCSPINDLFLTGGTITLPVLTGAANATAESVVFTVTQAVGEVRKFPLLGTDTGLNDGTA